MLFGVIEYEYFFCKGYLVKCNEHVHNIFKGVFLSIRVNVVYKDRPGLFNE